MSSRYEIRGLRCDLINKIGKGKNRSETTLLQCVVMVLWGSVIKPFSWCCVKGSIGFNNRMWESDNLSGDYEWRRLATKFDCRTNATLFVQTKSVEQKQIH
jgi:hypothetical protein